MKGRGGGGGGERVFAVVALIIAASLLASAGIEALPFAAGIAFVGIAYFLRQSVPSGSAQFVPAAPTSNEMEWTRSFNAYIEKADVALRSKANEEILFLFSAGMEVVKLRRAEFESAGTAGLDYHALEKRVIDKIGDLCNYIENRIPVSERVQIAQKYGDEFRVNPQTWEITRKVGSGTA